MELLNGFALAHPCQYKQVTGQKKRGCKFKWAVNKREQSSGLKKSCEYF